MAEEEKKFKVRHDLKSSDPEINEYIQAANQKLVEDEASSIKQLVVALNGVAMSIVSDLNRIAKGDMGSHEVLVKNEEYDPEEDNEEEEYKLETQGEPLIILNDDKNSKVFDRVMALVGKVKDFKELSVLADSLRPEIEEAKKKAENQKIQLNEGENAFEQMQQRINKNVRR